MFDTMLQAKSCLTAALDLLDSVKAPAEIGAYVDMAIHRIEEFLESSGTDSTALERRAK